MRISRFRAHNVGVFADIDIDIDALPGPVVALMGRNGEGKCLPGSTMVYDPVHGEIRLDKFVESRSPSVLGFSCGRVVPVTVVGWERMGPKPMVSIVSHGWSLSVATTHPVMTARGWVHGGDVRAGDHVAIARRLPIAGDLSVSDEEVRLAGYLIGDGVLTATPVLCATHEWKRAEFIRTLEAVFDGAQTAAYPRRIEIHNGVATEAKNLAVALAIASAGHSVRKFIDNDLRFLRGETRIDLRTVAAIAEAGVDMRPFRPYLDAAGAITEWSRSHGLDAVRAADKSLGSFSSVPEAQVPILLGALWMTDGYVSASGREVSYSTASLVLARQVRDQLLRIGVLSTLKDRVVDGDMYYTIALVQSTLRTFVELVSIVGPKGERLRAAPVSDINTNADSIPFEIWSSLCLKRNAASSGAHIGTWERARSGLSRHMFAEFGGPKEVASSEVWWAHVDAVSSEPSQECFDLCVDTAEHAYVADGVVVHNSQLCELMTGGILYRECETRGPIGALSLAPDSMIEATVVNGRPWTIRHDSGKGESSVTDANGQAAFEGHLVSRFDAWAKKKLPPPNVLYASTVALQGSAGFVGMGRADRVNVILRALGVDYLEALAEKARGRARTAKGEADVARGRLGDISEESTNVAGADARLEAARLASVEADEVLARAREGHAKATREAERGRLLELAWQERTARVARIEEVLRAGKIRLSDLETRTANNRAVLAKASEVRAAEVRSMELDGVLATLRVEDVVRRTAKEGHDRDEKRFREISIRAGEKVVTAWDRARAAKAKLGRREEIEKASKDAERLMRELAAAEKASLDAHVLVRELGARQLVSAEGRIEALRAALIEIRDDGLAGDGGEAPERLHRALANDAIDEDDHSVDVAREIPGEFKRAKGAAGMADTILAGVRASLDRARAIASLAPALESASQDLAAAEAERLEYEKASKDAETLALEANAKQEAALNALHGVHARLTEVEREKEALKPLLAHASQLAQAEARIAELEPQRAQAAADVQTATEDLEAIPQASPPTVLVSDEGAAKAAQEAERAAERARMAIETAGAALKSAMAAATRREMLRAELAAAEEALADWSRLGADLGKDGLQAAIVDGAGPELTELANDFLHSCHGPRFTIALETQRANSTGKKMIEDFDIRVIDSEKGRDALVETYSGGEKVILGEALSLSLSVLACRQWGTEGSTLVRDESGAALDEENAEVHVKMLRRAVTMTGASKVIVVSHTPRVWELADSRMRVHEGRVWVTA